MRAAFCLLTLCAAGCSFAMRVDLTREAQTAPPPTAARLLERASERDELVRLLDDYEAELTKQCASHFLSEEECGEQRRRLLAFRQMPAERQLDAYHALNDHAGELEHPNARRPLLGILGKLAMALARRR